MKHPFTKTTLLLILALASLGACKKKPDNNPFGNALIATASITKGGVTQVYQFFYNSHNTLDSVSINNTGMGQTGYLKYKYIGTSWSITDQNGNSFMVYANSANMILKVLVADTVSFTYSGTQLTERNEYATTLTPPFYTNTRTYYTWQNGDVTKTVTGTESITYTYNAGENGQPADPIRFISFLEYGVSAVKTTHLITNIATSTTAGLNYTYTFDSQGRISLVTEEVYDKTLYSHDITTYNFTYKN